MAYLKPAINLVWSSWVGLIVSQAKLQLL